ncbi:MAG: exopolyphosphatase [Alphaproteobacteria bacterium RIFOXYD12_FULL_60_8]|nr:MAG: exopolyphosphatase [Alphaproteobacteria bacterium RIFOXYD12_FULL_60_8]
MAMKKYRLVTRADFDGVVAGCLLIELDMLNDIVFAEPKDVQDGKVKITGDDILANLPYREEAYLCIDHHSSEVERVGQHKNFVIDPTMPSAARVVYEYFGGKQAFPHISQEMMAAVDKADSAQYGEEDILAPDSWTLLNYILDPRTGLDRFGPYTISYDQFMKDMMVYCRHNPVDEILKLPDVRERLQVYEKQEEQCEMQIRRCAKLHGHLVVVDLRNEHPIYAGNRFTSYAIYPQCSISIQALPHTEPGITVFAVGKSILNRTSKTDVGKLMLEYGGGGHKTVGTCRVPNDKADAVLAVLIDRITADG